MIIPPILYRRSLVYIYSLSAALLVASAFFAFTEIRPTSSAPMLAFYCDPDTGKAVEIVGVATKEEFMRWVEDNKPQITAPPPSAGSRPRSPLSEMDPECRPIRNQGVR